MQNIGLSAVLELASFNTAMGQYRKSLGTMGSQTASTASTVTGYFTSIGASVLKLSSLAAGAGFAALAVGLGAVATSAFDVSSQVNQMENDIRASLGSTEGRAKELGQVAVEVFKNNFAGSIEEAGQAVAEIERQIGQLAGVSDRDLQQIAEGGFALKDVFGAEIPETVGASRVLMEKFGLSGQEALDFITSGFQKGLNSSGDFLESITEYGVQFAGGGATADQFFSVMQTGLQGGVLGTDKAADAFKEFRVRIQDGSKLTADSLAAIGINSDELAEKMAGGQVTAAEAFDLVLGKLGQVDDQNIVMQAGVGLLGTQFEDLGTAGALALDLTAVKMSDMAGATETLSAKYNNLGSMWEGIRRRTFVALQPIGDKLLEIANSIMPQVEAGFDWLATVLPPIIDNIASKIGELITAFQEGGTGGLLTAMGLGDVVTAWNTVQPVLSDLWTWLSTNIPAAIQKVSDIWTNTLKPGLVEIGDAINTQLMPAFQNLMDAFSGGTGGTQGFADLWTNTLKPALVTVGDFLVNTLYPAWVELEKFLVGALAIAINLLADYWENIFFPAISTVAGFVKDTVIPALSDLWDWLGPKLGTGIQALSDLWTGTLQPALVAVWGYLDENIIPLFVSLGELFNAVLSKALEGAAGLWQNVLLPAIKKVGDFIKNTLWPAFVDVAKVVKDEASPILRELGEVVFPILQEGLDYVTQAIKDVIGYFDSLTDKVNNFSLPSILQGQSPPPMAYFLWDIGTAANDAATAIGEMGKASLSSGANVARFIDGLNIGSFFDQMGLGKGGRKEMRRIIAAAVSADFGMLTGEAGPEAILAKVREVAQRFNWPPSMVSEFVQMNGLVGQLTDNFKDFRQQIRIENLGKLTEVAGSFASLGLAFAERLKPQLDERADIIKRLEGFLKGEEKLFKFDFKPHLVGVDSVMFDRNRAQEQYNLLLREQREEQEKINRLQEAQSQLDFLRNQLDLFKLARDQGLDPRQIFEGITFGLNASVTDLVDATSNIVAAMVDQINHDLQIASPSRLMIKTFRQVMAGAAIGMERGQSLLSDAVRSIPILNGTIPQPVFSQPGGAGGGNTYNTYYQMPMTVNTAASPQAVIRQYDIKRSMFAAG